MRARFPDDGGRVIEIREGDTAPHRSKLKEVERLMDADMGFAPGARGDDSGDRCGREMRGGIAKGKVVRKTTHAFLYIREKRVLGCVVAERIESARRVVPEADGGAEIRRPGWLWSDNNGGVSGGLRDGEGEQEEGRSVEREEENGGGTASPSKSAVSETARGESGMKVHHGNRLLAAGSDTEGNAPSSGFSSAANVNATVLANKDDMHRCADRLSGLLAATNRGFVDNNADQTAENAAKMTAGGNEGMPGATDDSKFNEAARERGTGTKVGESIGASKDDDRRCLGPQLRVWSAGVDGDDDDSPRDVDSGASSKESSSLFSKGVNDTLDVGTRYQATPFEDMDARVAGEGDENLPRAIASPETRQQEQQQPRPSQQGKVGVPDDETIVSRRVVDTPPSRQAAGKKEGRLDGRAGRQRDPCKTREFTVMEGANGKRNGGGVKPRGGGLWAYFGSSATATENAPAGLDGGKERGRRNEEGARGVGKAGEGEGAVSGNSGGRGLATTNAEKVVSADAAVLQATGGRGRGRLGAEEQAQGEAAASERDVYKEVYTPALNSGDWGNVEKQKFRRGEVKTETAHVPIACDQRGRPKAVTATAGDDRNDSGGGGDGRGKKRAAPAAAIDDPFQRKLGGHCLADVHRAAAATVTTGAESVTLLSARSIAIPAPSSEMDLGSRMSRGAVPPDVDSTVRQMRQSGDGKPPIQGGSLPEAALGDSSRCDGSAECHNAGHSTHAKNRPPETVVVPTTKTCLHPIDDHEELGLRSDGGGEPLMLDARSVAPDKIIADGCSEKEVYREQEAKGHTGNSSSSSDGGRGRGGRDFKGRMGTRMTVEKVRSDGIASQQTKESGAEEGPGSRPEFLQQGSGSKKRDRAFSMDSTTSSLVSSPRTEQRHGRGGEEVLLPLPSSGLILEEGETPAVVGILQVRKIYYESSDVFVYRALRHSLVSFPCIVYTLGACS